MKHPLTLSPQLSLTSSRYSARAKNACERAYLGVLVRIEVAAQGEDDVQRGREAHGSVQKAFQPLSGRVDELRVYLRTRYNYEEG